MKQINVVAAVIKEGDKIFAAQRGYGEFEGWWEFPGGKIEPGEGPEEALRREIREELDVDVEVGRHLATVDYDYPEFHLHMRCYLCRIAGGELLLKEAEDARWLAPGELRGVKWLPADAAVIESLESASKTLASSDAKGPKGWTAE